MKILTKFFLTGIIAISAGCKKNFLDAKPDKSLLIPSTLTDFQSLLDNNTVMNVGTAINTIASDDIYTNSATLQSTTVASARNSYVWAKDIYEGSTPSDWSTPFQQIFYANVVLDGLKNITVSKENEAQWQKIQAFARFYRGYAYYNLSQVFASQYNPTASSLSLGIPIHLTSDVNDRPTRGNLAQTYAQMILDIQSSIPFLPKSEIYPTRPIKAAAYALLSKIFLTQSRYQDAKLYADSCLTLKNTLLDYNTLNSAAARPFPQAMQNGNPEILFYSSMASYAFLRSATGCLIDSNLFRSYNDRDLRKASFFTDRGQAMVNFKGSYGGAGVTANFLFCGLAVDEVYLIRAECSARLNLIENALSDINHLLTKRYRPNAFIPYTTNDRSNLLAIILSEKRKELVMRGVRWSELRRLNQEIETATSLVRKLNTLTYSLAPNDNRYTFPIPESELGDTGLEQNPR